VVVVVDAVVGVVSDPAGVVVPFVAPVSEVAVQPAEKAAIDAQIARARPDPTALMLSIKTSPGAE
jgi:hypothetical protein